MPQDGGRNLTACLNTGKIPDRPGNQILRISENNLPALACLIDHMAVHCLRCIVVLMLFRGCHKVMLNGRRTASLT